MSNVLWNIDDRKYWTVSTDGLTASIVSNEYVANYIRATKGVSSGKLYWEVKINKGAAYTLIGVSALGGTGYSSASIRTYSNGKKYPGSATYGATVVNGDIISCVLNMDLGTLEFYINGQSQGIAFSDILSLGTVYPHLSFGTNGGIEGSITANFGESKFVYENIFYSLRGYFSYDGNQSSTLVLLKQGNQHYSIKPEFYNSDLQQYIPLETIDFYKGFPIDNLFCTTKIGGTITDTIPKMTSNTAPSPYVISASTTYDANFQAWKAFNKTNSDSSDCWMTANAVSTGWIMIDTGTPTTVNELHLISRNFATATTSAPKDFSLQGSDDGISFTTIKEFVGEVNWASNETRIYALDSEATYRYYKLIIAANNGYNTACLGGLYLIYNAPLLAEFVPIDKFDNFSIVMNDAEINLNLKALKCSKQLVVANDDILTSIASHIDSFLLSVNKSAASDIRVAFSIDSGVTWKTWNSVSLVFEDLTGCVIPLKSHDTLTAFELTQWNNAMDIIALNGITPETLSTLNFNTLGTSSIRFAYVLNRPAFTDIAETSQLNWQFDAKGNMRKMADSEYTVDIYEQQIQLTTLITNELIKVNILR